MIALLALIGLLAIIGVVAGVLLFLLDIPAQEQRLHIERETQAAAWRIHQQTRATIEQMLDEARQQREHDSDAG